jgi:DNA-binding Xre family transcriptional regulator
MEMNKEPVKTHTHISDNELRARIETYFEREMGKALSAVGKLNQVKIMALLEEIDHLLIDYKRALSEMEIFEEDVLAHFSNEEILGMSKNKMQKAIALIYAQSKFQKNYFKTLEQICKENRQNVESMDEGQQERIAEISEFSLKQHELRRQTLLTHENLGKVVNNFRRQHDVPLQKWAKHVATTPAKLKELEDGKMKEIFDARDRINQMLKPMNTEADLLFMLYDITPDGTV